MSLAPFSFPLIAAAQEACVMTSAGDIICGKSAPKPRFKPSKGSRTETVKVDGTQKVKWNLKSCVRRPEAVSCDFLLTTTAERVNYGLRLNNNTKITDRQGREYFVSKATFVDTDGNFNTDLYREMQSGSTYEVSGCK